MQVRHRLARIGAIVEHQAKTVFGEPELLRHFRGFDEKMSQHLVIVRMRFGEARNRFLGNDQDVNGRLRLDVVEGDDLVVFVDNVGGYFARDDFLE